MDGISNFKVPTKSTSSPLHWFYFFLRIWFQEFAVFPSQIFYAAKTLSCSETLSTLRDSASCFSHYWFFPLFSFNPLMSDAWSVHIVRVYNLGERTFLALSLTLSRIIISLFIHQTLFHLNWENKFNGVKEEMKKMNLVRHVSRSARHSSANFFLAPKG